METLNIQELVLRKGKLQGSFHTLSLSIEGNVDDKGKCQDTNKDETGQGRFLNSFSLPSHTTGKQIADVN
jgi:hypothetical protein